VLVIAAVASSSLCKRKGARRRKKKKKKKRTSFMRLFAQAVVDSWTHVLVLRFLRAQRCDVMKEEHSYFLVWPAVNNNILYQQS
jgi:hypothetical protein